MTTLRQEFKVHETNDNKRHTQNLRRFRAIETTLRSHNSSMEEIKTNQKKAHDKLDVIKTDMATSADVKEMVQVFKTAKVGWGIFKLSWRTILLIGIIASGGLGLLGGWKAVFAYLTGIK